MGGDEFAFICPSMQDKASASVVCMRILNIMKEPVSILGNDYTVGISLGIAVFPDHAADAEVLVRRADAALYRAKEKRNTFVIFDPKLDLGK
jgi:diguanylate cyclase (GGDEF)-like protein